MPTISAIIRVSPFFAYRRGSGLGVKDRMVNPGLLDRSLGGAAQCKATIRVGPTDHITEEDLNHLLRAVNSSRLVRHLQMSPLAMNSMAGLVTEKHRRQFAQEVARILKAVLGAQVTIVYE